MVGESMEVWEKRVTEREREREREKERASKREKREEELGNYLME